MMPGLAAAPARTTALHGVRESERCLLCKAPKAEPAWPAMAWPPRGAKQHHAETLVGCVAFTERGTRKDEGLGFCVV
jgi:hypothetical protein